MAKTRYITNLLRILKALKADQSGASMLEYALLAFLIGAVLIGILDAIGISISDIMGVLSGTMNDANPDTQP